MNHELTLINTNKIKLFKTKNSVYLCPSVAKKIFVFFCIILWQGFCFSKTFYWKIDTKEKVVFLTFDDGPGPYTEQVLEILKKHNIKSTFFVLGEVIKYKPELLKKIVSEGHTIGSHNYSHRNYFVLEKTKSQDELKKIMITELKKAEQEIFNVVKVIPVYVRMPNGFYRKWMDKMFQENNYKIINWTFGYDWHNVPEDELVKKYCSALEHGGIYLFHDGGKNRKKTIFVLEKFIEYCNSQGYKFGDLKDYIK